ncbi:MAG: AEC family transporter [Kiritimatiellales bacterium]|nr:AEC family transporter [Kiritimatiellales bacterium]
MHVINSLAPIFLIIALGKLLQNSAMFPKGFFKSVVRIVFWIFLPALLIQKITSSPFDAAAVSKIALVMSLVSVLCIAGALLLSKALKLAPASTGAFVQGAFRGNLAFVGLPVVIFAMSGIHPQAETLATVTLAPMVIIYNLLSVLVLVHYGRGGGSGAFRTYIKPLITNPLILACAIAMLIKTIGWTLPIMLQRSLTALGNASFPLALLSIGASLSFDRLRGAASPSLIAALVKICAAPALGFLLTRMIGLGPTESMVAILMLASPAAAVSYVMAEAMHADTAIAGRIVVISTLLSAVSLSIIIALGT